MKCRLLFVLELGEVDLVLKCRMLDVLDGDDKIGRGCRDGFI
jgi:hypothetical protein